MQLIHEVPMVRQERQMSCWFAAAEMIKLFRVKQKSTQRAVHWGQLRAHVEQKFPFNESSKALLERSPLLGSKSSGSVRGVTRHEIVNWGTFKGLKSIAWEGTQFDALHALLLKRGPLYCAGLYSPQMQPHAIAVSGVVNYGVSIPAYGVVGTDYRYVLFHCPISGFKGLPYVDFEYCFMLPPRDPGVMMYLP